MDTITGSNELACVVMYSTTAGQYEVDICSKLIVPNTENAPRLVYTQLKLKHKMTKILSGMVKLTCKLTPLCSSNTT
jgi:hypothetical protein